MPLLVFSFTESKKPRLFSIFASQPSQNITVKLILFAMSKPQRLTNGQALLLELFHQDLTENDLQEVRNLLSRHFAQKARIEAQKYVQENNISQKELKQTTGSIHDNRTEYLRKIRKVKSTKLCNSLIMKY